MTQLGFNDNTFRMIIPTYKYEARINNEVKSFRTIQQKFSFYDFVINTLRESIVDIKLSRQRLHEKYPRSFQI